MADPPEAAIYQQQVLMEGLQQVAERTTEDWMSAITALGSRARIDLNRLGYFGLSMGARFGIPLGASLGNRLRCAVLGKGSHPC